jgi:hypothetical protein
METLSYKMPSLSRIKALIGALLATLAIAAAVQATAPDSASAVSNCSDYWGKKGDMAAIDGYWDLADFYWTIARTC